MLVIGAISKGGPTPFFLRPDVSTNYFYEVFCDSLSHLWRVRGQRCLYQSRFKWGEARSEGKRDPHYSGRTPGQL